APGVKKGAVHLPCTAPICANFLETLERLREADTDRARGCDGGHRFATAHRHARNESLRSTDDRALRKTIRLRPLVEGVAGEYLRLEASLVDPERQVEEAVSGHRADQAVLVRR